MSTATNGGEIGDDGQKANVAVLSASQVIDSLEKAVENAKIRGDLKSYESFVENVVDAGVKVRQTRL